MLAAKVAPEPIMFISWAYFLSPTKARTAAARRLVTSTTRSAIKLQPPTDKRSSFVLLELFHLFQVKAVEGSAYLEKEYSEYERGDEYVQGHAELDYQRHPVGGAGGGEEQAVLQRQEADYLRERLFPRYHHEKAQHDGRERDGQRRAGDERRKLPYRGSEVIGEYNEGYAYDHGRGYVDDFLDLLVYLQLVYEDIEYVREREDLERKRQQGRYVQVMEPRGITHHRRAYRKKEALPCEYVQKSLHSPLHEKGKGSQEYQGGKDAVYLRGKA